MCHTFREIDYDTHRCRMWQGPPMKVAGRTTLLPMAGCCRHGVSDVPVEVSADVTLVGRDVTQTQRLHFGVRHTGELLEQSAAAVEAVVLARAHLQAVAVKLLAGDAPLPLPAGREHLGDLRVPPGRPQREQQHEV